MVSQRLQTVPASGTIAISNLVSQMKAEGIDIVSFSMGEPDFTTPSNIIDAAWPADWDSDQDGVPDWYERIVGTDPAVADNNGDVNQNDYTNLEDYLEFLKERLRL